MRFALCNEMFQKTPLPEVCATAKRLGYEGIEIAPFTLSQYATDITSQQRTETRRIIADAGLETVGIHWLFVGPDGLHMTTLDDAVWRKTRDYLLALVELCHDLNGKVLVIGSPRQRSLLPGQTREGAWQRAIDLFTAALEPTADAGVTLCLEPLGPVETDFINSVEEGLQMVRQINHPNFKVHLDVKAMSAEPRPVAETIRSTPLEQIGHVHVNDPNLLGPGMGEVEFEPILAALKEIGWDSWLSVEVFNFEPGGEAIARQSIACLKSALGQAAC